MLDHFAEYTDIVGDHPYNIASTNQVFNACAQSFSTRASLVRVLCWNPGVTVTAPV